MEQGLCCRRRKRLEGSELFTLTTGPVLGLLAILTESPAEGLAALSVQFCREVMQIVVANYLSQSSRSRQ